MAENNKVEVTSGLYVTLAFQIAAALVILGFGVVMVTNWNSCFPPKVEDDVRSWVEENVYVPKSDSAASVTLIKELYRRSELLPKVGDVRSALYACIAAGCFSVVLAVACVVGVYNNTRLILTLYFVCSMALVYMLLCSCCLLYARREPFSTFVRRMTYGEILLSKDNRNAKNAINMIHIKFQCCSVAAPPSEEVKKQEDDATSPDYSRRVNFPPSMFGKDESENPEVPTSCCKYKRTTNCTSQDRLLYKDNCGKVLSDWFAFTMIYTMFGLGLGYSIIQVAALSLVYVYMKNTK